MPLELTETLKAALDDPKNTAELMLAAADMALMSDLQRMQARRGFAQLGIAHQRLTESRFWLNAAVQIIESEPKIVVPANGPIIQPN